MSPSIEESKVVPSPPIDPAKMQRYKDRFRPCPECGKATHDNHPVPGERAGIFLANEHITDNPDGTVWIACPNCGCGLKLDPSRQNILETVSKDVMGSRLQERIKKAEDEAQAELDRLSKIKEDEDARKETLLQEAITREARIRISQASQMEEITPEELEKLAAMFKSQDIH